jgi:transposase
MSEDIATVTRLQGYTFELRVDGELAHEMRRFAGSCRFVFNRALALQQELSDLCGFRPGYADLCKEMARWKKEPETLWLEDAPSQALQQSLKNLENAWDRHFEYAQDSNESLSFEDDLIRPEPWKDSSDGQGIEPQVPTINARHGSKYFGLKKGASAYTLVADQVQVF